MGEHNAFAFGFYTSVNFLNSCLPSERFPQVHGNLPRGRISSPYGYLHLTTRGGRRTQERCSLRKSGYASMRFSFGDSFHERDGPVCFSIPYTAYCSPPFFLRSGRRRPPSVPTLRSKTAVSRVATGNAGRDSRQMIRFWQHYVSKTAPTSESGTLARG